LNYSMFVEQITKVMERHVDQRAQIRINRIQKMNRPPADGMMILLPGENAAPAIYLDSFYQEYLLGIDLDTIAEEILDFHRNNRRARTCDLSFYMNFECARKHIVCRLVNYEANRDLLTTIPHQRFLDLAIVYYYRMEESSFGKSSILVRNAHLPMWEISQEKLHSIALANTRLLLPFCLHSMDEFLHANAAEFTLLSSREDCLPMYILSNEEFCFGAVNIIFEDVLDKVCELAGEDYYVIPSSIHECLILPICPDGIKTMPETLQEIVTDINQTFVSREEVLGNHIYQYTKTAHSLQILV